MRKILLLLTDLKIGGTPTVVRGLAKRLHARGDVEIHVACLSPAGPVSWQLVEMGIATTALDAACVFDVRVMFRLFRLIQDHQFDTVFSFLIHANAAAAMVAPFCRGVRFLQSIQTTQAFPRWHWEAQAIAQEKAEKIVVPSPSAAVAANELARVDWEKIEVIPNAVEPGEFTPVELYAGKRIGFIGRLDPIKRIDDLIHAIALLPDEFTLDIFGEGSERTGIENLIRVLDLGKRITLHGAVNNAADVLGEIDVLVLPSLAEGFGLVLIEAMAAGIPVIATNAPGIRDVVENGHNGLLVPIRKPTAIAAAIRALDQQGPLRARLIQGGKRTVEDKYTWTRVVRIYADLLELPD